MELTEDEVRDLVEAVRSFAQQEIAPHAAEWDQKKHFPVDVLEAAGGLGLGGIWIADDVGGSGLNRSIAVRVFEEIAKADPTIAAFISIHNMAVSMIDKFGTAEQRERWIPKLAAMEHLASYCLTEPDAGSDAGALRMTAKPVDGGWKLNGVKQFISGAGSSQVYVIMARTGGEGPKGISCFIVDKDSEGLSFGANEAKMGWNAQPTRQVIAEDLFVPADQLLGGEGNGFKIAMQGLNGGRLNIAASSLGGAQWAFDTAVEHVNSRIAFGKPLIAQQSLQFTLADMATGLRASRLMLHDAAAALDAGDPQAAEICAMTKRFVTDTCFDVANAALQLHGGYGYLSEYGIEKIVRDLRVHQILEGTNEIMRLVVGRSFVKDVK